MPLPMLHSFLDCAKLLELGEIMEALAAGSQAPCVIVTITLSHITQLKEICKAATKGLSVNMLLLSSTTGRVHFSEEASGPP